MLSKTQREFIEEYSLSYNATQAYHKIKPDLPLTSCATLGATILKKPEAQEYLKQLQQSYVDKYGDLATLILKELAQDIIQKDEQGIHNSSWQKSVELVQKQLGLTTTKIEANVKDSIEINIED